MVEYTSFNPYFNGYTTFTKKKKKKKSFNLCFNGYTTFTAGLSYIDIIGNSDVSILVLMDILLLQSKNYR